MKTKEWKEIFGSETFLKTVEPLYPGKASSAPERFEKLLEGYEAVYGSEVSGEDVRLFSAPGRTEIGGNHTDHQHGCVLAAAVDMDMIAAVSRCSGQEISLYSEGYGMTCIGLDRLEARKEELNTTAALLRGMAAAFAGRGCRLEGLRIYMTSSVLPGSGISSSAALEVLLGNIFNTMFFREKLDALEIAIISQWVENVYFGKPSGLMDQTACSVGNILMIDFENPKAPVVRRLDVDFSKSGLALCIINSGADHADLTDEYAAIPAEMGKVSAVFGEKHLRNVSFDTFLRRMKDAREDAGDRAFLRAVHYYRDNERVKAQAQALEQGDINTFLTLVRESGQSSFMYLQNIVPTGSVEHQEMAVALAACELLLEGRGAFRVHGGGFAGTVQAFVPVDMLDAFCRGMEGLLGEGCCHVLHIRPVGGTHIDPMKRS